MVQKQQIDPSSCANVSKNQIPNRQGRTYLQSDDVVKSISNCEIRRDVFDDVLPPSRRLEPMENDNRTKVNDDRRKDGRFCQRYSVSALSIRSREERIP